MHLSAKADSVFRLVNLDHDLPRLSSFAKRRNYAFLLRNHSQWDPLPKDRSPHTYARRSFFNRHFKIVRHTHRKHIHADGGEFLSSDCVAQFAKLAEVWPGAFRI